jgi:hypothetical protein
MTNWPTYEIVLPLGFNSQKFMEESEQGKNHLWLLLIDDEPGIQRYKGVIMGHNVRVFVDIISLPQKEKNIQHVMFVTTPHYQNLSAEQVANMIFYDVGGKRMFHDEEDCTP